MSVACALNCVGDRYLPGLYSIQLFDLMGDTVLLTHFDAADAKIKLTAEARRDVLERRLIHILRRSQYHQLSFKDLTEQ